MATARTCSTNHTTGKWTVNNWEAVPNWRQNETKSLCLLFCALSHPKLQQHQVLRREMLVVKINRVSNNINITVNPFECMARFVGHWADTTDTLNYYKQCCCCFTSSSHNCFILLIYIIWDKTSERTTSNTVVHVKSTDLNFKSTT